MSKNDKTPLTSFPAGSRTERPHHPEGWEVGGRKDDDSGAKFDPTLAQQYVERNKKS